MDQGFLEYILNTMDGLDDVLAPLTGECGHPFVLDPKKVKKARAEAATLRMATYAMLEEMGAIPEED